MVLRISYFSLWHSDLKPYNGDFTHTLYQYTNHEKPKVLILIQLFLTLVFVENFLLLSRVSDDSMCSWKASCANFFKPDVYQKLKYGHESIV